MPAGDIRQAGIMNGIRMSRSILLIAVVLIAVASVVIWLMGGSQAPVIKDAAPIAQVNVPALSSAAKEGENLFNSNCAVCHGTNAAGKQGIAPPLVHIIYEPNHHGDQSFILAVQNGVRAHHWPFGNMPPIEGVTEEQVKLITLYVRELQRANGIF